MQGDTNPAPALARPRLMLLGALVIGFAIEMLLHGQPIAAGYAVASVVVVVGWIALGRGIGLRPSPSAAALLAVLVFLGAAIAVRASVTLRALDVLLGLALVLLIAALYVPGRLGSLGLIDYATALLFSSVAALARPFSHLFEDLPRARPAAVEPRRGLAPVLLGVLLALPLLLIFGALFAAADAVFEEFVRRLFDWQIDLADLFGRLLLSLMLAWLALGLLRHAFLARADAPQVIHVPRPSWVRLSEVTAVTVLALVNVLFLAFVVIQAVYLFGGLDTLARSGLTHSAYARRGFFELVTVAALVVSLILTVDWLAVRDGMGRRVGRAVSLLHGLLVVLTLVILASALYRMWLYTQEFGLTELRLYTTAFMLWIGILLAWLAATVLVERAPDGPGRRRFALGALVAGLAVATLLNLANPDALIARYNLARATAGVGQPLDSAYLSRSLSADAVPALLDGLERLPNPADQKALACALSDAARRLTSAADDRDWRGNTWGEVRAHAALAAAGPRLAEIGGTCKER